MTPLDRIGSWLEVRALRFACFLAGHKMARHFTDLGLASPSAGEQPWCARCGKVEELR